MNITINFSFYVVVLNYKLLLIPYDFFFSFKFWYLMARANDLNAFFYLKSELIFKGKKKTITWKFEPKAFASTSKYFCYYEG